MLVSVSWIDSTMSMCQSDLENVLKSIHLKSLLVVSSVVDYICDISAHSPGY